MAKKIKKKKGQKILKKTKKTVKQVKKKLVKKTEKVQAEGSRKVNWAALPGEEPSEEEYLNEDYPEEEGFGTEEVKIKPPEDDYEKAPAEHETPDEEEEL